MPGGEFRFELRVCRWAERRWPPDGATAGPRPDGDGNRDGDDGDGDASPGSSGRDRERPTVLVARQLGTERRRWDTVVVECDPAGLRARAAFGPDALDPDLLGVLRHAPAEWTYYRDALPEPSYPWRYVREATARAADRGVLDRRKRSNRVEIRRVAPYPDWVRRVVAVENKPDLSASAARALTDQLERDVALALADEAWVATRATGDRVEPVLLADLPVEAGVLAFEDRLGSDGGDGDRAGADDGPGGTGGADEDRRADGAVPTVAGLSADVEWRPRRLPVEEPGTRILDRPDGGEFDRSAARFEYADPDWKARKRLAIAERAYGRGWRDYVERMRADCRSFRLRDVDGALLPHCVAKGRPQTGAECSGSCPEFAPEPPAWRTKGPPIEGGPGRLQRRLLDRRRRRRRPGLPDRGE